MLSLCWVLATIMKEPVVILCFVLVSKGWGLQPYLWGLQPHVGPATLYVGPATLCASGGSPVCGGRPVCERRQPYSNPIATL